MALRPVVGQALRTHGGKIKAVKVGHFWRISETELQRLLSPEENQGQD